MVQSAHRIVMTYAKTGQMEVGLIATLTMNPSLDNTSYVDRVIPERKLRCKSPRYEPGGGGVNVARAVLRLGGRAIAFYPAGGSTGKRLTDLLNNEGIDSWPIPIAGWTRENLTVYEESTGQQFRFGMPGPTLQEDEWNQCLVALSEWSPKPSYIVASGSLPPGVPMDFYARVARVARSIGARLIVDSSGEALSLAVREGVFLIKPNLREFTQLVKRKIRDESQQRTLAKQIIESGQSEAVVISLGAGGATLVTNEISEHVRAPTVPVESNVGAGDSMVAGIVLALTKGLPLREAARFGVAAGAAAVMTPGTELCRRKDAVRLYKLMRSMPT